MKIQCIRPGAHEQHEVALAATPRAFSATPGMVCLEARDERARRLKGCRDFEFRHVSGVAYWIP